jgi:arrestin-related trafficking adapter 1
MDHLKEIKRHSLGSRHLSDKKASPKIEAAKPVKTSMVIESPPLVFYGSAQSSTGALFSGQLFLDIAPQNVTLEKLEMQFLCTTTAKKPVAPHCADCASQTNELKKWEFLSSPLNLSQGKHTFPFSYLIPGHLPATTHGALGVIDYHLAVHGKTSTGDVISFDKPIEIKRSIIPGNDKHSVRIFPPTNLTAQCTLPSVIHPIGQFPLEMRLAGVTTRQKDAQVRWRLRKLVWRIEEHQKMVSPACPKHAPKLGGEGKGVLHEDTRCIGQEELKSGWKSDFDDGTVEIEFKGVVNPSLKPICDVDSPNGLKVHHTLIIEMVVAEEWVPLKRPTQITPTGAARVLRTQFNIVLTERSGLGISWDEEQPPMYEDVPASPPTYIHMEETSLQELGEDMEHFHLG